MTPFESELQGRGGEQPHSSIAETDSIGEEEEELRTMSQLLSFCLVENEDGYPRPGSRSDSLTLGRPSSNLETPFI